MYITPVNQTNFTHTKKDAVRLIKYAAERQKGSLCDLNKKFHPELVDNFIMTNRLKVQKHTQNWSIGEMLHRPIHKKVTPQPREDRALDKLLKNLERNTKS